MISQDFKNIGDFIKERGTASETKDKIFLQFEDETFTFSEYLILCSRYARMFTRAFEEKKQSTHFHVGILMQNYPEFMVTLGACALCGATLSAINTGQKGASLSRDINFTDCMMLITDNTFLPEVENVIGDLELIEPKDVLVNNFRDKNKTLSEGYTSLEEKLKKTEKVLGTELFNLPPDIDVDPLTNLMIIFTSGTTGAPKGIINSHAKLIGLASVIAGPLSFSSEDVAYGVMPHFHSNSTFISFIPALLFGAGFAFRKKFSASGFLPDIKKYGVTTFNYVGKPMAYILAATEGIIDHDNKLRIALGNGASAVEQKTFMERFGLDWVMEVFGSTEGGATVLKLPGDVEGSVGVMPPNIKLIRDDGEEVLPAQFDNDGVLQNYTEAVGEIINTDGLGSFEGYFKNPEATNKKTKDGMFHTGDLAYYRLEEKNGAQAKFMFFAGRKGDWIRKDGENFLSEPIENIITQFNSVFLCSVYGAPCHQSDELVMASLKLNADEKFDPANFFDFLTSRKDMNEKWYPDFVRILKDLPQTETVKINPKELKKAFFNKDLVEDQVYWRERNEISFKPFEMQDYKSLKENFIKAGRVNELVRG